MQSLVTEAKRNHFATVPKLSDEDVINVWETVASFIGKNMGMQKGVAIPGFGLFTFSQRKLDVGNNKYILIQRPVFVLSEKFAMTHALQTTKYHTNGQIPVIPLNFAALSYEMNFSRDIVEGCVKEMLQALSRSVQMKRNVEFVFSGIGKLTIKDLKAKMKFQKDFLQEIDQSGNLLNAMRNRPETCDSVISGLATPRGRPSTCNTIILPRITPGDNTNDPAESNVENIQSPGNTNKPSMPTICEEAIALEEMDIDMKINDIKHVKIEKEYPDQRGSSPARLHTAPEKPNLAKPVSRCTARVSQAGLTFDAPNIDQIKPKTATTASPQPLKSLHKSAFEEENTNKDSDAFVPVKRTQTKVKVFDKTCSNCLHDAGQELCYLCYQRERRNVPVYLHEQRKKKEQEEDRLLQQYQHLKDYDAILKDQVRKSANREEAQKIAAFNFGAAEAIKGKRNERSTDFHRSFIFQRRCVSPPFYVSQQQYNADLADQVRKKAVDQSKMKTDKDFLERLEQVQLAQDLAAQREQCLKNKKLQSEEYRKALDTQIYIKKCIERQLQIDNKRPRKGLTIPKPNVIQPFEDTNQKLLQKIHGRVKEPRGRHTMRFKPLPLPAFEPDSDGPYFGKHDMNHDKMFDKKQQARRLFEDQLLAAAEKKRHTILNDLRNQKEEALMLSRARKDLLEETINRNSERVNLRRSLEDTWLQASKMKNSREKDEKRRAQSPGILLHEQCTKYRRCQECKRKLVNCGESNVWCESRYLSGSRIMV